jgi:hypothetical protein
MQSQIHPRCLFHVRVAAFYLGLTLRDWDRDTVCSILSRLAVFVGIKAADCPAFKADLAVIGHLFKALVVATETGDFMRVRDTVSQMVNAAGLSV